MPRTPGPSDPRPCNRVGCSEAVILALRMPAGKWRPYEARDRDPDAADAVGAHVLVAGQAWTIPDLVEDYMVRHDLTETAARQVVTGFAFHRPHLHHPDDLRDDQ